MVSDCELFWICLADLCLNPCSNGIWSLTWQSWGTDTQAVRCLNPCSNGIWSLTPELQHQEVYWYQGLNPCSNGIWSLTICGKTIRQAKESLNPCSNGIWSLTARNRPPPCERHVRVLILVLMEYGLWPGNGRRWLNGRLSLNPCSNGIWSLTLSRWVNLQRPYCLNPCSNGIWSLTILLNQ